MEKKYRNLSGIFFREKVGDKWLNVCFEELSEKSQDRVLDNPNGNENFVKNLAKNLAETIKTIGDKCDIILTEI